MLTSFAGARLFGETYGTGTPWVLALHGWRRDHRDFDAVLAAGPAGAPLDGVALDLPGFGSTPPPETAWGSPDYADSVAELLEEMADQVVVVGHSFGGRVAVHLAARRPERIAGLVLSGVPLHRPPGARSRPSMGYRVVRELASRGLVGSERLEATRRRYGSADYLAASGVMRDVLVKVLGEQYHEAIAGIGCPVELVWGDDDTGAPISVAERVRNEIEGSHLVVCPGAGHLTPLSVPGELRAAIERLRP